MNKKRKTTINTPFGEKENIEVEETAKQETRYGPVLCCATIARLNDTGEKVCYYYGDTDIGKPVFMNGISATAKCRRDQERNQKFQKNRSAEKV